jgi:site-specific DNA-methyltransferase (adenine-specific)
MSLNVKPRSIFCKDNLDILRGINNDCIDLIYLDPPFNKKKQFSAPVGSSAEGASFSDIFRQEDIKDEWVKGIEYENPELHAYLTGIKAIGGVYNYCYLVYMAIRLIECKRVLKDTGSLYLHCDPTMSHYLKVVLDCVFGEKNFRNEIVWCYKFGGSGIRDFARKHDIIFRYCKTESFVFNHQLMREFETESNWGKRPDGKLLTDWQYIPVINTMSKERTGYPTQKPLALLERIILASSNKGDVVLDPFCGCATTCIAAEKLGRKWIGVDVSHKAFELVKERLKKEVPPNLFRGEPVFSTIAPARGKGEDKEQGFVYVITNNRDKGFYKIGIAKNVKARLNSYQTADPFRSFELVYQLKTPYFKEIERDIHAHFAADHEWIEADKAEIIKEIKRKNKSYSS